MHQTPPFDRTHAPTADASHQPALAALVLAAARGLHHIRSGRSGSVALVDAPPAVRPGAQALLYHALRHLGLAQALRSRLAPRTPPPAADALLCTALALASAPDAMGYEPFTLVNQVVNAAKLDASTRKQAAFINACLRRFLRERDALMEDARADPVAEWNYPRWWIERVRSDWPADWQGILEAGNAQAPMVLRINRQKSTPASYIKQLSAIEIDSYQCGEDAVALERALPVHELPGFAQGVVSVQDASAQRAAQLLLQGLAFDQPLRVLDACAAPGGKTAHLLEIAGSRPRFLLTALDVDPVRCTRISETLTRIGMTAQVLAHDASKPEHWWKQHCAGQPFDAILLDAPCTASGIVRRHPDVRWLRRESDIAQLAVTQAQLLTALWPLVASGGRLLYCTCSIFRAEGDKQIEMFLARNTDARLMPSAGHILPLPSERSDALAHNRSGGNDGFYYALLQKQGK